MCIRDSDGAHGRIHKQKTTTTKKTRTPPEKEEEVLQTEERDQQMDEAMSKRHGPQTDAKKEKSIQNEQKQIEPIIMYVISTHSFYIRMYKYFFL